MRPLRSTVLHPQWFAFRDECRTRQWVQNKAHGRVLDIGCAGGWVREVLCAECEYVGLDYPVTALGIYGTRPDVFADGACLPFSDCMFDTVVLLEVLEHVAEPERVLEEIRRVLKPGGLLLLSMPFLYPLHDAPHDYQRYTAPGLAHAVRRAGLECGEPIPRIVGLQTVAMLAAITCADGALSAFKEHRWRLIFAPLLVACIPVINSAGWLLAPVAGGTMLAGGYSVEGRRP